MDWKKEIKLSDLAKRNKAPSTEAARPKASILKKEVSLRRRPRRARPAGGETSFLKKEISFGRRPKADEAEQPKRRPRGDRVPFWKREVTIGRRAPHPVPLPAVEEPEPEPVAPRSVAPRDPDLEAPGPVTEPLAPAAVARPGVPAPPGVPPPVPASELPPLPGFEPPALAERTSVLKRELSFRRKPKAEEAAGAEQAPKADRLPFWRRELAIGRRRVAAAETAQTPEEGGYGWPAEPVAAPAGLQAEPEPEVAPGPPEHIAAAEPLAEASDPVAVPAVEEGGYGWLAEPPGAVGESPSWVDLVAGAAAEPDPDEPAEEPEPVLPGAVSAPVEEPEPEPVAPASVAVPEPDFEAPGPVHEPVAPAAVARPGVPAPLPGVHPPVPASELAPLPGLEPAAPTERTSVLKRELSFRRKPKAEKAARAERATEGDRVPFWKRELTFGRKPKQQTTPQVEAPQAARARVPFWKRELTLRRQADRMAPAAPRAERPGPPRRRAKREKGVQRHKKLVGLKIGASQVAAARVVNNGSAQLLQVARRRMEPGIVVGGELRDPDALAEVLRVFFRDHKLPKRGIRLGIATNRIGVRSFELEEVGDAKQLQNAIRFRAQEALPIPIEEAVLDYQLLGESETEEGVRMRRVLLVVAYRELVDRYVDACRKAGIRLVGIDLEAFALLRALGAPRGEGEQPAEAATVAVAIGYDRSTFAVSDGRVCEFTRVLEWGGFAINVAIARALDIAPSEAEPFKRELSLTGNEVPEGLGAEQADAVRDAMRRQVGSFARELVSSLQFYQSQPSSLGIAEITITGGTAHLAGLGDELQRLIGVPVRVGDPLGRLRVGKKVALDDQVGSLAIAIGLGIED